MTDRPRKTALVVSGSSSIDYLHQELPDFMYIIRQLIVIDDIPYRDVIEYKYEDFMQWIHDHPGHVPQTFGGDSNDIAELCLKLVDDGYTEILFLTQGKRLSGTYDLIDEISIIVHEKAEVEIFDTGLFGPAELVFIIMAARLIQEGKSMQHILNMLHLIADNTEMYIIPNDVKYIVKQLGMGKVSTVLTSMFDVKPVIRVHRGKLEVYEKIRNTDNTIRYIATLVHEICDEHDAMCVGMYTDDSEFRKKILRIVKREYVKFDLHVTPSLVANLGPDTVAAIFFKDKDSYLPPDFEFKLPSEDAA